MDVGGYRWIWVDMGGYGRISLDMDGYGWICVDMGRYNWIWRDLGARGFARLRRTSPSTRPEVHLPKKLVVETWNLAINRI